MRVRLACLGLLALLSPASAQRELPSEVRTAMEAARNECSEPSKFGKGFIARRDVNLDGVADFILDYGRFECGDSSAFFCGTGGCLTQVFASLPNGGYAKVLDENVRQIAFKVVRGRPAMVLDLHGSACGKVGAEPCPRTLFWNGRSFVR